MMNSNTVEMQSDGLVIPMYSWWQTFLMSFFDVEFNKTEWTPSPDPEVRALSVLIPKYSLKQMFYMTFLDIGE